MGQPLFAQAADTSLQAESLSEVAVDGSLHDPIAPAIQNASILIALPVVVMVIGAVLYLAMRGAARESPRGGAKGGLYLMVIGFLGLFIELVYLMIA